MGLNNRAIFHRIWDSFLDSILPDAGEDKYALSQTKKARIKETPTLTEYLTKRSMSFSRLREKLWSALYTSEDEWAYPIDAYVDNNQLYALASKNGMLFRISITISSDDITLGEWVRVEEQYTPVAQTRNNFTVRRQKDGTYRWLCIAGTTVLNRVGEIDSSELFDSFIEKAERTGKYPRLDYYHMGETNPKMWDFGTADYLAREGVCYIASGTFDEDHPLAKAAIKACSNDKDGIWGNSIEFYAYSEPETILADPEVKIPIYKDGENTRISMVLEKDAAGLFTRIGINEEIKRTMDDTTKAKLVKLFGEDSKELENFIAGFEGEVDGVNRTVQNDKLIHRAKDDQAPATPDEDEDDQEDEDGDIVLDESAIDAITQQMIETPAFKSIQQGILDIKSLIAEVMVERSKDVEKISKLERSVENLGKEDVEKKEEWLQDLPSRGKRTVVSHRPGNAHRQEDVQDVTSADIAQRTLGRIPKSASY